MITTAPPGHPVTESPVPRTLVATTGDEPAVAETTPGRAAGTALHRPADAAVRPADVAISRRTDAAVRPTDAAITRRAGAVPRRLIGTAAVLLGVLQVLALDERNPLTRTLSSYEYTRWGWLFPASLVVLGIGIAVLAARLDGRLRAARALLAGAAGASFVTAAFPSGDVLGQDYWPGEVHRWGSIALMVLVLAGALCLLPRGLADHARSPIVRLVTVGSVAGLLFLAGQTMKPAVPLVVGFAPLAGGLTQRILVAAVAGVLLIVAAHAAGHRLTAVRAPDVRPRSGAREAF
ncbi:MAG TPA: DUF998 domain-containing protein [Nakamurella sp.]|nr:DUF998 domain-containing protein [Nakamurella sp.]